MCKLHGLFAPEHATQININLDRTVEQLEKLPDAELLKIAGTDNQYLMPKKMKRINPEDLVEYEKYNQCLSV